MSTQLIDLVRVWFNNTPHIKTWLLDGIQFVAKGPHSQKGYVFIEHNHIEAMRYHQYGGGKIIVYAADPELFDKLNKLLDTMIL